MAFASVTDDVAMILDIGSGTTKAGLAGESEPRVVLPTVAGQERRTVDAVTGLLKERENNRLYVGEDATSRRGELSLVHPVDNGVIKNWDDMEQLFYHIFYAQMRIDPQDHPVLMTEAPLNPPSCRENAIKMMFETMNVPSFFLSIQATLALHAHGFESGIVLDMGAGMVHATPIWEGFLLPHCVSRLDLSGEDITEYFHRLLWEEGKYKDFSIGTAEKAVIAQVKEKVCYVSMDFERDLARGVPDVEYQLPDGRTIVVGAERFRAPEILFDPQWLGTEQEGIDKLLCESIEKCDIDLRRDMWGHIVLCGGSSMFEGMDERLLKTMRRVAPDKSSVRMHAPDDRKYSVWHGGSILAALDSFDEQWITRDEYDDVGVDIVNRRCPMSRNDG